MRLAARLSLQINQARSSGVSSFFVLTREYASMGSWRIRLLGDIMWLRSIASSIFVFLSPPVSLPRL